MAHLDRSPSDLGLAQAIAPPMLSSGVNLHTLPLDVLFEILYNAATISYTTVLHVAQVHPNIRDAYQTFEHSVSFPGIKTTDAPLLETFARFLHTAQDWGLFLWTDAMRHRHPPRFTLIEWIEAVYEFSQKGDPDCFGTLYCRQGEWAARKSIDDTLKLLESCTTLAFNNWEWRQYYIREAPDGLRPMDLLLEFLRRELVATVYTGIRKNSLEARLKSLLRSDPHNPEGIFTGEVVANIHHWISCGTVKWKWVAEFLGGEDFDKEVKKMRQNSRDTTVLKELWLEGWKKRAAKRKRLVEDAKEQFKESKHTTL